MYKFNNTKLQSLLITKLKPNLYISLLNPLLAFLANSIYIQKTKNNRESGKLSK